MEIEILDAVYCKADKEARKEILKKLKYKGKFSRRYKGRGGTYSVVEEMTRHYITGRQGSSGYFYTGLLPRLKDIIKSKKIKVSGKLERIDESFFLDSKLWEHQKKARKNIIKKQRGIIEHPTGTGKTVVAISVIKTFRKCRILYVVNTIDLLQQTYERFKKERIIPLFTLGGGHKINMKILQKKNKCVLLSTIQSLSKIKIDNGFFDVVIIDEAHHVSKENGQYGKVLQSTLAPVRIGLTATPYEKGYERLVCEGYLGPVIAKLKTKEAVKRKILVPAKIKLIPVPYNSKINKKCDTYKDYYKYGIIKNVVRNKRIAIITKAFRKKGKTVLIMVEQIEHGENILKYLKKECIKAKFIKGDIDRFSRSKIKENFESKKYKVVVATKVWREGIDIPSLDTIINAACMKDPKLTKQIIGRGLRSFKNKKKMVFIDFLDPYKYLAEHTILRLQTYREERWI